MVVYSLIFGYMHFVFSYDLGIEAGNRRNEIERNIVDCLPDGNYTRQLNNFFIVKIDNKRQWDCILEKLTSISSTIPETFYFIMSPPVEPTKQKYNGMLPTGRWTKINELTTTE